MPSAASFLDASAVHNYGGGDVLGWRGRDIYMLESVRRDASAVEASSHLVNVDMRDAQLFRSVFQADDISASSYSAFPEEQEYENICFIYLY